MDKSTYQAILELQSQRNEWESTRIEVEIDTFIEEANGTNTSAGSTSTLSNDSGRPKTMMVNLVDHIGKAPSQKARDSQKGRKIYLSHFNENTERYRDDVLLPYIHKACKADGFSAIAKGFDGSRKQQLRIMCQRGRKFQKNDQQSGCPNKSFQGGQEEEQQQEEEESSAMITVTASKKQATDIIATSKTRY
jgi:hypothetical protein